MFLFSKNIFFFIMRLLFQKPHNFAKIMELVSAVGLLTTGDSGDSKVCFAAVQVHIHLHWLNETISLPWPNIFLVLRMVLDKYFAVILFLCSDLLTLNTFLPFSFVDVYVV